MKLSANEEYGLRCLVRIGYAGAGGSLTIPEMSQAEGVSPAYAAKILRGLRKGGLVKAVRGKEGGYTLARPAEQIVIGDVMDCSAAASSKAPSARAMRAGRRSARAAWTALCARYGARFRARWTRCSAEPLCATSSKTKRK